MIRFLLRRLFHALLLVVITLTVTFFILRLAPGDPVTRFYSPDIDPAVMSAVRHEFGLDRPLPVQYAKTLLSYLRGDFGVSLSARRPVSSVLAEAIPRTLLLAGAALVLQITLGLLLGSLSARHRYGFFDRLLSFVFLLFYSIPSFYLAFALIALFSLELHWLPSASMHSIPALSGSALSAAGDRVAHMVLPVAVLALGSAAVLARYTRGSLLDAVHQDFIKTARAKGLGEGRIFWVHAMKNALPQVFTVIGLSVPFLLGGAVVVEKIFAWPGMGSLAVDSIYSRDYPVALATNFIAACMVILGNLLADLSYAWVNPQVRSAVHGDASIGRRTAS
jgi:peptide/nickel transport system permease protein